MKKLVCSLVLLLVGSAMYAQLIIIPKAGASYSTVAFSDDFNYGYGPDKPEGKMGIVFGASLELDVRDWFAIQSEILFHQKGFKIVYDGPEFSSEIKFNLFRNSSAG